MKDRRRAASKEVGVEEIKKFLDNPPEVENLMAWKCLDYGDIDRLAQALLTKYSIRRRK